MTSKHRSYQLTTRSSLPALLSSHSPAVASGSGHGGVTDQSDAVDPLGKEGKRLVDLGCVVQDGVVAITAADGIAAAVETVVVDCQHGSIIDIVPQ